MRRFKLFCLGVCLLVVATADAAPEMGYKQTLSRVQTTIAASGKSTKITEEKNIVTTPQGATQLSNYVVTIQGKKATFQLIRAQVKTEGKVYSISPEKIKKSVVQNAADGGLRQNQQVVIPLEQVKVGSEVSITYKITNEPLMKGNFFDAGGISNVMLADTETVTYLSDTPLKLLTQGFGEFYSATESKIGNRFKIEISPTEQARLTVGKVQKVGMFFVSTSSSWKHLNQLISAKYEKAVSEPLPKAFADIVEEARKQTDSKKKIEFVAERLKKVITYAGDWRTAEGGYFPMGHAALVKSGRGDCKDYSTSMAAILRKLGFQSNVALSFRSGGGSELSRATIKRMPDAPSLAYFNHAIVWAKDNSGQEFWLDPTNTFVIANVLSSDLLGNIALILDGKSEQVRKLPVKNAETAKTEVVQTVSFRPDNTAMVTATMDMNPVAFNDMAILERQAGPEVMKLVLSLFLNPRSKMQTRYKVGAEGNKQRYNIEGYGNNWIFEEKGKVHVLVSHPAALYLMKPATDGDFQFGQNSETTYTTTVKNHRVVDPVPHHCLIRSKWIDVDREIKVIGNDTIVKDRIVSKEHIATAEEVRSDEFKMTIRDISGCADDAYLLTKLDPSLKTVEQTKLDALKGPDLDKMTEEDFAKLRDMNEPRLFNYKNIKLRLYSLNQVAKNPASLEHYADAAWRTYRMGYLSGDNYRPGYVNEAMEIIKKGQAASNGKFNAYLLRTKIRLNLSLMKTNEALADFKVLLEKDPKNSKTAEIGAFISRRMGKLQDAERWWLNAIALTTVISDKDQYRQQLAEIYQAQQRHDEAIKVHEEILKGPNVTAWQWHNAAIVYQGNNNFDRAIEYEKKALELMDFGAARWNLSELLYAKAQSFGSALPKYSVKEKKFEAFPAEALLLEAIKYNGENIDALTRLAHVYSGMGLMSMDQSYFEKAGVVAAQALKVDPQNQAALGAMAMVNHMKKRVENPLGPVASKTESWTVNPMDPKTGQKKSKELLEFENMVNITRSMTARVPPMKDYHVQANAMLKKAVASCKVTASSKEEFGNLVWVDKDGRVTKATFTPGHPTGECIHKVIYGTQFPKPFGDDMMFEIVNK